MDKKDINAPSSDDEHFEDANEKIVNELIEKTTGVKISDLKQDPEHDDEDPVEAFEDCETNDLIDDESQKDFEKDQTEEEREEARLKAVELKQKGNDEFKEGNFEKSAEIYTLALRKCPVVCANERSILYGNRALSKVKLDLKPAAIDDCTKALEFNPSYVKVLLR
jgi:tetratricopeptide (TPR) repeat protein